MLELSWQSENLHIITNANQLVVVLTNATNHQLFIVREKQTYIMLQSNYDLETTTKTFLCLDIGDNYQHLPHQFGK